MVSRVPSVVCPIHNPVGDGVSAAGTVPDVTNFALDDAIERLNGSGYTATVQWDPSAPLAHGTVYLQSLPFSRMADRIIAHAPSSGGSSQGEGSVLGGIGRLLDGD